MRLLTSLLITVAASLFVLSGTAWAVTVCQIGNGCTGTSTVPSYGKILIGGSNGEYELVASSTLGSSGGVSSVFGRTGAVTAQTGDYTTSQVPEGSNLYYTLLRWASALAGTTTDALAEGISHLYFTNARAQSALAGLYEVPLTFNAGLTRSLNTISLDSSFPKGFFFATTSADWWGSTKGYLTSLAGAASSTLLGDNNTFSGIDKFSNSSSDFGGTWQTFSPSHFQTALGFTAVPNTRAINTTYPLQGGGDLSADRTLSVAYGTTTANSWGALQTIAAASTTNLSATNFWLIGQSAGCAQFDSNAKLTSTGVNCGTGTGGNDPFTHTSVYGQTTSASSTLLALTGSPFSLVASSTANFVNASTTNLTIFSAGHLQFVGLNSAILSTDSTGQVVASTSIGANLLNGAVTVSNGGTGSTTLSSTLLSGNGISAINSYVGSACGANTFAISINGAGVLTCAAAAAGGGGSGGWTFIKGGIYNSTTTDQVFIGETSTTTTAKLEVNGGIFASASSTITGLLTLLNSSTTLATHTGNTWFTSVKNALLGTDNNGLLVSTTSVGANLLTGTLGTVNTSAPLGGGGGLTAGGSLTLTCATCYTAGWPWNLLTTYGTSTNATTTPTWYKTGLFASSTSQLDYASTTALSASAEGFFGTASTTNLTVSGIRGGLLGTNMAGTVSASTTIGWNLLKGAASSIFAFDQNGNPVATTSIGANFLSGTVANAQLANSSLTVNTNSPLGGGGAVSLGGSLTLTCTTCITSAPAWPWNLLTNFGTTTNASTTPSWFQTGLFASSTSQFTNASSTLLTTGTLWDTGLSQVPLYADANGKVISAGSGTSGNCVKWGANNTLADQGSACGTGGGGAWPWNLLTTYGTSTDATTTPAWFQTAFYASSTASSPSVIDNLTSTNSTTTNATTTTFGFVNLKNSILSTNASGGVVASTSIGANLLTGILGAAQFPALTGDITTSAGSLSTTLKNTGTAGTYRSTTFDAQGRETSGTNPTTFAGYGLSDTSANFGAVLSDETGTPGSVVFSISPTFTGKITAAAASTTDVSVSNSFYDSNLTSVLASFDANHKEGSYGGTSCTNQFVRSLNGAGVATCNTVSLTADVTGTLPVANGGTGSTDIGKSQLLATNSSGNAVSTSTPTFAVLHATSTLATSTFAGPVQISVNGLSTTPMLFVGTSTQGFPLYGEVQGDVIDGELDFNGIAAINIANANSGSCAGSGFFGDGNIVALASDYAFMGFTNGGWTGSGCAVGNGTERPESTLFSQPTGDIDFELASTSNAVAYKWYTKNTTNSMLLTNTGYLGIATSTPFWDLTVASSTGPQIGLTDGTASDPAWTFRNISGNFFLATSTATATSTNAAIQINTNSLPSWSIGTTTAAGILNLGAQQSTNSTSTIMMGKIQFDGYDSAGNRRCVYLTGAGAWQIGASGTGCTP